MEGMLLEAVHRQDNIGSRAGQAAAEIAREYADSLKTVKAGSQQEQELSQ